LQDRPIIMSEEEERIARRNRGLFKEISGKNIFHIDANLSLDRIYYTVEQIVNRQILYKGVVI